MVAPGITTSMQDPNGFLFYDRMNDVNGTQMINHQMVKDGSGPPGWTMGAWVDGITQASSTATIQSNTLRFSTNSSIILMGSTSGAADPTVSIEWTPRSAIATNSIITRYQDNLNMVLLNFRVPDMDIQIVSIDEGVITFPSIAPMVWNINQTYKIEARHGFVGFVTGVVDGVNKVNSSTPAGPSVVGLMRNNGSSLSEINNFTVKAL